MSLLAALLGALLLVSPAPPRDGRALLQAMYDRYAGTWYHGATFVQKTTHENGEVETWYEAMTVPGRLRIDIAPLDSGRALIFRSDSIYIIGGDTVRRSAPLVHPLMVLGFDVYGQSPDTTAARLESLHMDLSKIREDTWQGRPVYVVGADAGDSTTNQFWVDQERLLFVRLIQRASSGAIAESQFNKYQPLGGGWMAPEVIFYRNGKVVTTEEYSDIRERASLPDSLFLPKPFARAEWIGEVGGR